MKRRAANLLILALVLFVAVALINLTQNLRALPVQGPGVGAPPVVFAVPTLGLDPLILAWVASLAGLGRLEASIECSDRALETDPRLADG